MALLFPKLSGMLREHTVGELELRETAEKLKERNVTILKTKLIIYPNHLNLTLISANPCEKIILTVLIVYLAKKITCPLKPPECKYHALIGNCKIIVYHAKIHMPPSRFVQYHASPWCALHVNLAGSYMEKLKNEIIFKFLSLTNIFLRSMRLFAVDFFDK